MAGPSFSEPGVFDVPHRDNIHLSATQPHTVHPVPRHQGVRSRASPAPQGGQTSTPKYKRVLRRHEPDQGQSFEPVSLVFAAKTTLADLGKGLSQEELNLGRRLVRFQREKVGDTVYLSLCRISPEAYVDDGETVAISCIYRKETRETCYTSVDMIRLVEYIAQSQFSSEEKSRIRRNLEFLHPTTVTRTGMPQFFQILMDFPIPKPRVIEKDIKVFQWNSLEAGLKKVLEKYVRRFCFVLVCFSLNLAFAQYYRRPGPTRMNWRPPQTPVLYLRDLGHPRTNFLTLRDILHRAPSPLLPHPTVPIHQTTWGSPPTSCQTCSLTQVGFRPTAIESGSWLPVLMKTEGLCGLRVRKATWLQQKLATTAKRQISSFLISSSWHRLGTSFAVLTLWFPSCDSPLHHQCGDTIESGPSRHSIAYPVITVP